MNESTRIALNAGCESALLAFGPRTQMVKTCEEMGELTTQLCKNLNGSPTTREKIVDEVADATIMVSQMRILFGPEDVDARIIYKLDRLMHAIRARDKTETQGEINA